MAVSNHEDGQPKEYYSSIEEWTQATAKKDTGQESGRIIPFDFGGMADFRAARSLEQQVHPALTPYRLQPSGGYLAVIPGGKIWGSTGTVLSADGRLIFELSQEYDSQEHRMLTADEHPVFRQWNSPYLLEVPGTVAVLSFCGSPNYYHWLYDVLPRYAMLQAAGIHYTALVMNPNPYGAFVEETFAMLGIPEAAVIRASPGLYMRPGQLLVPSLMMNSHYPPWTTQTLRRLLLPYRDLALCTPGRIFVSRRHAEARRIVNEEDVVHCLEQYGFTSVCLEDYTVAEQIQMFAAADAIAGPHGAGLANLAFCRPGTKVIEIFHERHIVPTYWMISNHNDLDYYMLYAKGCPNPAVPYTGLEDIRVDTERLRQTLDLAELNA
ncbi:glycosyltransferase family 61 protein [Paenibacillus tepidiphilus]|uniref:glycosyltransferase family 61 protein n=1 Tax=Paenibacillus tepidiphilus TaxID=2608683 RepID=UPI001239DAB0|nr:glycosyltransferase family 61 protein [Paenibacillus tepidiphilus]